MDKRIVFLVFSCLANIGVSEDCSKLQDVLLANEATHIVENAGCLNTNCDPVDEKNLIKIRKYKTPVLAAAFGVVPGLGHVYLGEQKTALGLAGLFGSGVVLCIQNNRGIRNLGGAIVLNSMAYSSYAAYRDARIYDHNVCYRYKMATDSLADLAYAPFNGAIVKKPEVWGGVLGALTVGTLLTILFPSPEEHHDRHSPYITDPLIAFPVGIGEEAFFRGFLLPAFAEETTPWGGIILSSLAFGAAHIGNASHLRSAGRKNYYSVALPFITAFGVYFGWLTQKNCSLKESVAIHTWYDFILFSVDVAANQAVTKDTRFDFNYSF